MNAEERESRIVRRLVIDLLVIFMFAAGTYVMGGGW